MEYTVNNRPDIHYALSQTGSAATEDNLIINRKALHTFYREFQGLREESAFHRRV